MRARLSLLPVLVLLLAGVQACASTPVAQLPPEELYRRGQAEMAEEDWGEAVEYLDRLLLTHPGFEEAPAARMMLARAYFNDEKYLTAHQEYQRFLERNRGHPDASEAALGMCRSYAELSPIPERDPTYTEEAATICRQVVQDWAGIDDGVARQAEELANRMRGKLGEKMFLNADHYFERQYWDSAIIYFELVVESYGDTVWAPRAMARIIESYRQLGYDEEVADWEQRLQDSYPNSPEARALRDGGGAEGPAVADTVADTLPRR